VHNSFEDQSIDRTLEITPDEAEMLPPPVADPNHADVSGKPVHANRRKFISLFVVGAVGVATAVTVGGITFAREIEDRNQGSGGSSTAEKDESNENGDTRNRRRRPRPHRTPTPGQTPTPQATGTPRPTPTGTPRPTPTTPPAPTPTPAPTGTVIGQSSQATNIAVAFTNPADGQASWLVHMSNGNFVAVEQACTHAGVAVKYNATSGQFNCPAHGAIFNADGTNPQSPATRPLPPVHITVNANGTITTP
jgi:Rieske Fe-S protein